MATVNVYNFSKKENSTLLPTSGALSFDCILKEPCGILAPVIGLDIGLVDSPASYNYAYIPAFNRYYFIREWSFENRLWYASLEVDSLGSWRSDIGATTEYILRSSAAYNNTILDSLYPTTSSITTTISTASSSWAVSFSGGRYVIGIINGDLAGVGAVSYYVFTQGQFKSLCNTLLNSADWLNLDFTEISEELLKTLFNPFEYIVSCYWFPFIPPTSGTVSNLYFGWWSLSVNCSILSDTPLNIETTSFTVPKHPQSVSRGTYLNLNPYTRYLLDFKPFGQIPVDTTELISTSTLYAIVSVDCVSGIGTMGLSSDGRLANIFFQADAMVGVPIQLAQIGRDYLGVAASAIGGIAGTIGNVLSGNIGGAITGAVSSIESTIRSSLPQVMTSGSNGSISDYYWNHQFRGQFFPLVNESLTLRGRPLCEERQISTIPGYILCADSSISLSSTAEEQRSVVNYMNSGFFYE